MLLEDPVVIHPGDFEAAKPKEFMRILRVQIPNKNNPIKHIQEKKSYGHDICMQNTYSKLIIMG